MRQKLMTTSVIKKRRAFTLIELLIAITIFVILATAAIPSLKNSASNMRLDASSRELQSFINRLRQQAIVDSNLIVLNIAQNNFAARLKGQDDVFRKYSADAALRVESNKTEVLFYPDGRIDPVEINLIAQNGSCRKLTTKGVFGAVKLLPKE